MANKMTKKDYYARLAEVVKGAELLDETELLGFISHEVELLNKKSSAKTQTKTQKANEDLKVEILKALVAIGKAVTVSELQSQSPAMAQYTNQKLSALLKQLIESGEVEKTADKKRTLFKAV